MKVFIGKILSFVKNLFCDGGVPSSSRVLTFILAMFGCACIGAIFRHLLAVKDATLVAVWMSNLPMVIGSLTAFAGLPYGINRGASTLSDIIGALKKKE